MNHCANMDLRSRVLTVILLLAMAFCVLGQAAPDLVGNPFMVTAQAADTGTGDPNSIFDIVGDTGEINQDSAAAGSSEGSIATLISKYRTIAVGLTGVLTITMLIFMLIQFTKLGAAGDNEQARKRAIMGILTTGIATALLGGATIVVGFFWNVLGG